MLTCLKDASNAVLKINMSIQNQICAWVDPICGGEPGFCRKSFSSVVVYDMSLLQKVTTFSSTEADLVALSEASRTIFELKRVLSEFGIASAPSDHQTP